MWHCFFVQTPAERKAGGAAEYNYKRSPEADEEKKQRGEQSYHSERNAPEIRLVIHVSSLLIVSADGALDGVSLSTRT